jgi:hypothetical protein
MLTDVRVMMALALSSGNGSGTLMTAAVNHLLPTVVCLKQTVPMPGT